PGRFSAVVRSNPCYVDASRCTGCGACEAVCPVEVPDEFDLGLRQRKAIYRPFAQAVPRTYHLDKESCTGCGLCVEACKQGAIDLDAEEEVRVFQVGAILLATGYELFDASSLKEYGYGTYADVLTALELERMMNLDGPTKGQVRCQDGKAPQRVAFILCVGSRDGKRAVPYCSKICCMYAMKQARLLLHLLRGVDVWVFYTDIRAAGKGYEEFYALSQEEGIVFNRGKVAAVQKDGDALLVRAENTLLGELVEERFDLVILCPAMIGSGNGSLAKALDIPLSEGGFFAEIHPKLNPVDLKGGIMGCGCCLGPKDVRDSITEAMAAAAQTSAFLGRGEVVLEPTYVAINYARCDGCEKCLDACPSDALVKEEGRVKVEVTSCTGCGFCIPACPTGALDYVLGSEAELMAQIDEILSDDPRRAVLCFLDKGIPYAVLDRLATERRSYPAETQMILVPSVARIKLDHLRHIFSRGCRDVAMIYSEMDDELEKALRKRIKGYKELVEDEFGPQRIALFKVYAPQHEKLAMFLNMLGSGG
ncbi:MAG: 4Fe-4S binding protein, partial [Anaerolineae bacterium]